MLISGCTSTVTHPGTGAAGAQADTIQWAKLRGDFYWALELHISRVDGFEMKHSYAGTTNLGDGFRCADRRYCELSNQPHAVTIELRQDRPPEDTQMRPPTAPNPIAQGISDTACYPAIFICLPLMVIVGSIAEHQRQADQDRCTAILNWTPTAGREYAVGTIGPPEIAAFSVTIFDVQSGETVATSPCSWSET